MYDYPSYLIHHGVDGQKWGKRNGPPYPLNAEGKASLQKQKKEDRYSSSLRKGIEKDQNKHPEKTRNQSSRDVLQKASAKENIRYDHNRSVQETLKKTTRTAGGLAGGAAGFTIAGSSAPVANAAATALFGAALGLPVGMLVGGLSGAALASGIEYVNYKKHAYRNMKINDFLKEYE